MLTSDYNSWDKGIFNVVGKQFGDVQDAYSELQNLQEQITEEEVVT